MEKELIKKKKSKDQNGYIKSKNKSYMDSGNDDIQGLCIVIQKQQWYLN